MALLSQLEPLVKKPLFLAVKTTCPFCINALKLAQKHKVPAEVVKVDVVKNGTEIQKNLFENTGQRTVPFVYSKGRFIGGFTELAKEPESFWKGLQ